MEEAATHESEGARGATAPPRARATLLLAVLAIALSAASWKSSWSDGFVLDRRAFWGAPWRFFAAALAHPHALQLVASLAGLWLFGRAAERLVGAGRLLALVALFVLGIGFAEQAFDHGGNGLSGVVFGLWALLLVGGWRKRELRGTLPLGLHLLMLAAFAVCVLWLPSLAWGHAAGVLLGALAGACLDARGEFRQALVPLAAALLLVLGAGATRWRTSWNFGGASVEYDRAGCDALERGDEPAAEQLLRTALKFNERDGQSWWNLGSVLARLDRTEEAAQASWRAYENMGLDADQRAFLEKIQLWALNQHIALGEPSKAFPYAQNVAKLLPDGLEVWERVRELAHDLGDDEWFERADRECQRLDPDEKPLGPDKK